MTNPVTISDRSVMMVPAQEYDEFQLLLRNNIPTIYSAWRVPTKIPYNCHGQKFRRRCEWKFSLQSTDDGKSIIQLTKPNCGKRKLTKIGFLWRRKKFESTHVVKSGSEQKSLTMRRSIVSGSWPNNNYIFQCILLGTTVVGTNGQIYYIDHILMGGVLLIHTNIYCAATEI